MVSDYVYLVVGGVVTAKYANGETVSLPKGSSFGERSLFLNRRLVPGLHFQPEIISEVWMVHRQAFAVAAARYRDVYQALLAVFREHAKDYVRYSDMEALSLAAQRKGEQEAGAVSEPAWFDIMNALKSGVGTAQEAEATRVGRQLRQTRARIKSRQGEILTTQERLMALQEERAELQRAMLHGAAGAQGSVD